MPTRAKGTGAVKITPAHDFNDFEVGKRHKLRAINILTIDATITIKENEDFLEGLDNPGALHGAWDRLEGQDRFTARKIIVEIFEEAGLLDKIEPHKHMVPHGDRGGVPIEPRLTEQWYVECTDAGQAGDRLGSRRPHQLRAEELGKDLFRVDGEHPALVHLAPALVGTPDPGMVRPRWSGLRREDRGRGAAGCGIQHYLSHEGPWKAWVEDKLENFLPGEILTRDEDVLDTWFSSALWPFSTLGWPDKTPELARYYPTNVLVTGFDIIFFWVARMMMMGLHFMKDEDGNRCRAVHTSTFTRWFATRTARRCRSPRATSSTRWT
jgi:valyl-tRNA synthetase